LPKVGIVEAGSEPETEYVPEVNVPLELKFAVMLMDSFPTRYAPLGKLKIAALQLLEPPFWLHEAVLPVTDSVKVPFAFCVRDAVWLPDQKSAYPGELTPGPLKFGTVYACATPAAPSTATATTPAMTLDDLIIDSPPVKPTIDLPLAALAGATQP
jgi:hypothetical protein